jgi:hypothetical protein
VVGDSKTLNEIVQIYERIYDAKPDIKKLGSLPNLYEHMHTLRAESPDEWFRYMPMYVFPLCRRLVVPLTLNKKVLHVLYAS